MQVSSELNCPWCFYKFDTSSTPTLTGTTQVYVICPQCSAKFKFSQEPTNNFIVSADCSQNELRHAWKYRHVQGYDLWKKCRRCGKEDKRPAQLKLPGLQVTSKYVA